MQNTLLFLLLIVITACDKEKLNTEPQLAFMNCEDLQNAERLTEAERSQTCTYTKVYNYKDELHYHCVCCVCNKSAPITSCEGNVISDEDRDTFFEKAEFLFCIR